jgi:hypothetical protein
VRISGRRIAPLVTVMTIVTAAPNAAAVGPDCSALEKKQATSKKLDALLAVAQCHAKAGKLLVARADYLAAIARARAAKDKKSLKAAEKALKELEAKLAFITVSASPDVSEVRVDGEIVTQGAAVAVEPGAHVIMANGPGRPTFTKKVELRKGDTEQVTIPASDKPAEPPTATTEPPQPPKPEEKPEEKRADDKPAGVVEKAAPAPAPADGEPHAGFTLDVEQLLQLYQEPVAPGRTQAGHSFVTVATVGYDFAPSLRAFARWGLVGDSPPERSGALAFANPALGGRFSFAPISQLRVGVEAGVVLPLGSGGGDPPAADASLSEIDDYRNTVFAMVRGRALHPALFDPNYLTPYVGLDAGTTISNVVVRVETFVEQSLRVRGSDQLDSAKTRLRFNLHGGYLVIPQIEPFLELRWFRFLSEPSFVPRDTATADTLFGALGVAFVLAPALPLRLRLAYLRALDEPLTRDDFDAFSLQVGVDF